MSVDEKRPLPESWEWTEICNVAAVNLRDRALREMPDEIEVTFVPMAAVDDVDGKIVDPQVRTLGATRKGYTPFSEGDVLFAKITPCMENGKAAIARNLQNGLGFGSTEFHVMKPGDRVLAEWLYYFVRQSSFRGEAKSNFSGTAGHLRVKKGFIEDHRIPLAPLPEQTRIVAEIEKQFTRLDQAVASLKRAQANLQRYKASVLKAACEGRLVPQDPDDDPAEILLQRILAERRRLWQEQEWAKLIQKAQKKVAQVRRKAQNLPARLSDLEPEEWQDIPEADYARYLPKNDKWKEKYKEPVVPDMKDLFSVPELPACWAWASVEQYTENYDSLRIPVKKADRERMQGEYLYYGAFGVIDQVDDYLFDGRYLLLAEDGKNLESRRRPIALVAEGKFWVNNHAHVMQTYLDCPLEYLKAYFDGTNIGGFLTGMDQVKLTRGDMNRIPLAIPPLQEQYRIVAEIERRLSVIAANEKAIAADLARAERLRQSILQQAFSGQLVPNVEPKDISELGA